MNSTSFSLEPISQDGVLVTIALVLVAVLAILTVLGMIWGARLKRRRRAAEHEEERRIAELKSDGVTVDTADPPARVPAHGDGPAYAAPPLARSDDPVTGAPPMIDTPPVAMPAPRTNTTERDEAADRAPRPASPPARPDDASGDPAPLADEPIAAAAPLDASPASVAADVPVPAPDAADDVAGAAALTTLKGLGPKIATRLTELGITRIDQLAWLDDAEAGELDAQLGAFQGRMERDRWREQARLLAAGDRAGYEAQFGKLG
jgi:predicted flap endonuclease-1-like 5' DNA nuclease